jgi:hypothetical protein
VGVGALALDIFGRKKWWHFFHLEKLAPSLFAAGHVSKIFKLESSLPCPHVDGP